MAGKGGGAWKVAYADFVTAMMAFFLVMWIVAQNRPVREAVAGYFRDPTGKSAKPGGNGYLPGDARKSRATIESDRPNGGRFPTLAVLQDPNSTTVQASVLFGETSAELDDRAKSRLQELAKVLAGYPTKVEIRGYSAKLPQSTDKDKPAGDPWLICYQRCVATMQFLTEQGIEPARIRLSQGGPVERRVSTREAVDRRQNSRVEIYMLNESANDVAEAKADAPPTPKSGEERTPQE